jgi:hypothetical protein
VFPAIFDFDTVERELQRAKSKSTGAGAERERELAMRERRCMVMGVYVVKIVINENTNFSKYSRKSVLLFPRFLEDTGRYTCTKGIPRD